MKRVIIPQSMIPALLSGAKTQHRVLMKDHETLRTMKYAGQLKDGTWMFTDHMPPEKWDLWFPAEYLKDGGIKCPWQPGDEVWAGEGLHWQHHQGQCTHGIQHPGEGSTLHYDADGVEVEPPPDWKPRINPYTGKPCGITAQRMPRWAARIFRTVKAVRVERVQDITASDVGAEGVPFAHMLPPILPPGANLDAIANVVARTACSKVWDRAHGPGAWDRNDWVWVLDFEEAK